MRFSLNYEKIFRLPVNHLFISVAGGVAPSWWNQKYLWFPIRTNLSYGGKSSFAEISMNLVYGYFWNESYIHPDEYLHGTETWWLPAVGYRYGNLYEGGLFMKLSVYPILNKTPDAYSYLVQLPFPDLKLYDKEFVLWLGVSAGYTFKPKKTK